MAGKLANSVLAEDSPARRRLLTVRHGHVPASRRSCRGHVGRCFRAIFQRIENMVADTRADDQRAARTLSSVPSNVGLDLFAAANLSSVGFFKTSFLGHI